MSIVSEALHGQITWAAAAAKAGIWLEALIGKAPAALQPAIQAEVSIVKQGVSDALGLAEGAIPGLLAEFNSIGIPAFERAVSVATHGLSDPFNPLVSQGLQTLGDQAKAGIDAAILEAKALLAGVPASPPAA